MEPILAQVSGAIAFERSERSIEVARHEHRGEVEAVEASGDDYRALFREFAIRYLGEAAGNKYADSSTTGDPSDSVVMRLTPSRTISWG